MSDDEATDSDVSPRLEAFLAIVEKFGIDLDDPVESADDLDALEELDLSEKQLEQLPDDLFDALPPKLKTLALEKNALTQLPTSFGQDAASLSELTELYLRENRLTSLPDGIGSLTKLESLYLEDNQLVVDGIPDGIGGLAGSLTGLCLHRNLLTVGFRVADSSLVSSLTDSCCGNGPSRHYRWLSAS